MSSILGLRIPFVVLAFGIISAAGCNRDLESDQPFVKHQGWPMAVIVVLKSTDGQKGSWHMSVAPNGLITTVHNGSVFELRMSPMEVESLTAAIEDCGTVPDSVTIGSMMPDQATGIICLIGVRTQSIIKIEGLENVDLKPNDHKQWIKFLSIWTSLEKHAISSPDQSQLSQYINTCLNQIGEKSNGTRVVPEKPPGEPG